ncbi:MAG: glycosyltransferase family 4 protein [Candidatus Sericytochromatia bacterium]|nr:glycosyltransferase family 4 protein [Candidatus Sericytochromatia bacterium]
MSSSARPTEQRQVVGRSKRLLLVISTLGTGGAERVLTLLANAWSAMGHEVTLVTFDAPDAEPFFLLAPAVKRVGLNAMRASAGVWEALRNNASRLRKLRQAVRAAQPDVVVSFIDTTNVTTLLAVSGLSFPVVVSERTDPHHHAIGRAWTRLRRLTYPRATAVVVQSHRAAAYFANTTVTPLVIPNPVKLPALPARTVASDERHRLVTLGRLQPVKGQEKLLSAFARLAPHHPSWTLTIHGEGPERAQLEATVSALGLQNRVFLPGATTEPFARLVEADLFVLSSAREGFPNALCEAMAVGLPVVSFDCPSGPAELITHNVDGLLVPPGDVEALAAALDRLMGDPAERARLGTRAREVRERLALPRILAMWDEVFREALEGRASRWS